MSDNKGFKVGRATFGKKGGPWTTFATLWVGRFGDLEISFSKKPEEGSAPGRWPRGKNIQYDDGGVIEIGGVYPKIYLEEGYRLVGPGLGEDPGSEQEASSGSDDIPF